jgi:hypothetical protein
MGTRADFYVGRGVSAQWIGSIAMDGYPAGEPESVLKVSSEEEWRAGVADLLNHIEHATSPEQGWPWPWDNGHLTDYSYSFAEGRVWVAKFGHGWWPASEVEPTSWDKWPKVPLPDMTGLKRLADLGTVRSGVILIGGRRSVE